MMFPTALLLFLCFFSASAEPLTPVIQLPSGPVRGLIHQLADGTGSNLFLGIRYGVVKKRFSLAEPHTWTEVRNASEPKYACPQPGYDLGLSDSTNIVTERMSEDCLFLNVYQPRTPKKNRTVMVWIHGGAFISGTIFADYYEATYLAALGDVVVVTINYRLGPFGFLYSDNPADQAPGNQGLHDQILALKWVRDNIGSFGGDPNRVTIFGESAGSMSVGSLYLSPLTKGLFKRAIMQSGSPNSYLGSTSAQEGLRRTKALVENLNCQRKTLTESLHCIRSKNITEILKGCKDSIENGELMIPIYGDSLMPQPPVEALVSGHFNEADLMFGVVRNEGSGFVAEYIGMLDPDNNHTDISIDKVKTLIGLMMSTFGVSYGSEVVEYYTKNLNPKNITQMRLAISDVFGDYHLVCPTILFGEQVAKTLGSKHHFYTYRLVQPLKHYVQCHGWMGVCHAEDVLYLFGMPLRKPSLEPSETQLSRDMIESWTSFAKTGQIQNLPWKESLNPNESNPSARYMSLDSRDYKMVSDYFKTLCDTFWKPHLFPKN